MVEKMKTKLREFSEFERDIFRQSAVAGALNGFTIISLNCAFTAFTAFTV